MRAGANLVLAIGLRESSSFAPEPPSVVIPGQRTLEQMMRMGEDERSERKRLDRGCGRHSSHSSCLSQVQSQSQMRSSPLFRGGEQ